MERVQITYTFSDYFGITAGHFLTPYGIWNADHGSPVILMTRAPFMQTLELAPSKQLGVQLFGRAFLSSGLTLDYAGTVSNGRGPLDSVMDIDENKGLGLRWKLACAPWSRVSNTSARADCAGQHDAPNHTPGAITVRCAGSCGR